MVLHTTFGADSLRQGLDRLYHAGFEQRLGFGSNQAGQFVPRVNCVETGESVVFTIELPGVDPADMSLQHQGGFLILSGLRRPMISVAGRTVCFDHTEGKFGAFRWSCPLPAHVLPNHVRATIQNGLLFVEFSKVTPELAIQHGPSVQIPIH